MTKRTRTRTIDTTAHDWRVEMTIVKNAMAKHLDRLETLKMASYEVYLVFSHCFGLDGHEDCSGSQERISEHLEKEHGFKITGGQVHDDKHTGICWVINAKRRRKTNKVARIFNAVITSWESRAGRKSGAGLRFLRKHQKFKQILSAIVGQKSDFFDKLEKYERIYRKNHNQKLLLSEIVQEFARGKEISQIVFELKDNSTKIVEKDADLFLEIAIIFSGENTQDGDISDQAREIVNAIKEEGRTIMTGEITRTVAISKETPKPTIKIVQIVADTWRGLYNYLLNVAVDNPTAGGRLAELSENGQLIFRPGKAGYLPIVVEVIKQIHPGIILNINEDLDKSWVRNGVVGCLEYNKVMLPKHDHVSKQYGGPSHYIILDPKNFVIERKPNGAAIKRRLYQGEELMGGNNLDFIRGKLQEAISGDMNIFEVFTKKVEAWKEKNNEDLFLTEVRDKFLAGDNDSTIEFDLNLPKGEGAKRLELVLRLSGSEVQLQDQPSEWAMTTLVAIEEAYKVQLEQSGVSGDRKVEQAELSLNGLSGAAVLQEKHKDQAEKKPTKKMPEYYYKLWEHLFDLALEKRMNSGDVDANRAVWAGSYFEAVKQWTTDNYPSTKDSKPYQFRERWQALEDQKVIIVVPPNEKESGARSYYILDPNQFNFKPTPGTDTLRQWLGLKIRTDKVARSPRHAKSIKVTLTPDVESKIEGVVIGLKDAVIAENQKRIESLSQEIVNLDIAIQETRDKLSA